MSPRFAVALRTLLLASLPACLLPLDNKPYVHVRVDPREAEMVARDSGSFVATVLGTPDTEVAWTVSGGTFTATGDTLVWTAPTDPGLYTLTATSVAHPEHSGSAEVRVTEPEGLDGSSFAGYRGTAATLPPGMFVTGEDRAGRQVHEGFDPFTGISDSASDPPGSFDGFGAFTSGGQGYSFGIRERGDADLREARLFLAYENSDSRAIAGFEVEYDVEVWRLGERANQIRLKLGTGTRGFSELPDLVATPSPRGGARGDSIGLVVDGSRPENRTPVVATVLLADLPGPDGMTIGSLAPGDTAYFRWQYSNAEGDEGEVRSALAISNVRVAPLFTDDPTPPVSTAPLSFSHEAGFHTQPFELELGSWPAAAVIYYTVDGSRPDPARVISDEAWEELPVERRRRTLVYERPIGIAALVARPNEVALIPTNNFSATPWSRWTPPAGEVEKAVVIRVLAMHEGREQARASRSYFIAPEGRRRYSLPVVSIAANRTDLFSWETGIYVPGASGVNYMSRGDEWERPAHLELFELDGSRPLAQEVGIRIHGGWTRHLPQKSLRLYARDEYGTSRLSHRFFASKAADDFNRLILRNGGNDWALAVMRDAALQTLVQHLPFETQHYQPAVVFLNGEYWGLHAFRDRLDPHHLETHHGVPRDRVAILERDAEISDGEPGDELPYRELLAGLQGGELSTAAEVDAHLELSGYLDYVITQMYAGNTDWPQNNISWWRYTGQPTAERGPRDGRWRWLMYDVDWSFGSFLTEVTNPVEHMFDAHHPWAFDLFRALVAIPEIRDELLQRIAVHLATTFEPGHVRRHLDALAAVLAPEMPERIARWSWPSTLANWERQLEVMRAFAAERPATFRGHVVDRFGGVQGTARLELANLRSGAAPFLHTVEIAPQTPGVVISGGEWSGELFTGLPVVVRSEPLDLRLAEISGGYAELERGENELRFILTGDARLRLP
jgi:hypothetical protein